MYELIRKSDDFDVIIIANIERDNYLFLRMYSGVNKHKRLYYDEKKANNGTIGTCGCRLHKLLRVELS